MILRPDIVIRTLFLEGNCTLIATSLFLCLVMLVPVRVTGQGLPAPMVLSSASLPPLTTPDRDGYLDRLYTEWFERAGLRAELVSAPAARGLENANAGLFDGDAARIYMDSSLHPDLHRVPEPLFQVIFSGLSLDSTISVDTPAEFENYRVGYVRGWQIAEQLFKDSQHAIAVRSAEGVLNMLAANRIDIAFLTIAPARTLSRQKNMPLLKATSFKIEKDVFLYLNASHRDKIPKLANILRIMKSDGSYDQIMDDYVAENR